MKKDLEILGHTLFVLGVCIGLGFLFSSFLEWLTGKASIIWLTGSILMLLFLGLTFKLIGDGYELIIGGEKWSRIKDRYIGYIIHPNLYLAYTLLFLGVFLIFAEMGTWWVMLVGFFFFVFGIVVILRKTEMLKNPSNVKK